MQAALDHYEANPDVVREVETWREEMTRRSLDEGVATLDEIRQRRDEESADDTWGSRWGEASSLPVAARAYNRANKGDIAKRRG